jgi:hypothetical protein
MKKQLLSLAALIWACSSAFAQTTILAQWTFPNASDSTFFPDSCISANSTKYLSAEDTTAYPNTIKRDIAITQGYTTYAATAIDWKNGANAKLWSIKFKTNGASNITVSSKQFSDANNPGPKYWKMQARLSADIDWTDITGGNVTCANDWTTGAVTDLALPVNFNNQTGNMFIRWIMISDSSSAGTIVDSLGISKIDDVIIKGTPASGIEEVFYNNYFNYYPNPNSNGILFIKSAENLKSVNIYNLQGKLIESFTIIETHKSLDLQMLKQGMYFIQPFFYDNSSVKPQKLIIE